MADSSLGEKFDTLAFTPQLSFNFQGELKRLSPPLFVEGPSEPNRAMPFHILSGMEMRLSPGPLSPFQPKELEFGSTEAFPGVGRVPSETQMLLASNRNAMAVDMSPVSSTCLLSVEKL